jgi:hypothetical protein
VLLAREGKPLFRKSYGLANAEWDIANTPDTKFRIRAVPTKTRVTVRCGLNDACQGVRLSWAEMKPGGGMESGALLE